MGLKKEKEDVVELVPVVQNSDNFIHWISYYLDNLEFIVTYLVTIYSKANLKSIF